MSNERIYCQNSVLPMVYDCTDGGVGIEEAFTVKVDWDVDLLSSDGCHGTDFGSPAEPVELTFTKLSNGDIYVKGPLLDNDPVLTAAGELKVYYVAHHALGKDELKADRLPSLPAPHAHLWNSVGSQGAEILLYAWNTEFYSCYQDSAALNAALTVQQRAIVDRFFSALALQFPEAWAKPS